jgi:serine/threonine protein phosphatase PrpC
MPDFTLLPDQTILLIQIAAGLFVAAFLSFLYVSLTSVLSLQRLKKTAGKDTDNLLVCDVAYFNCRGKRENQEDSVYISPLEDSYTNGVVAACSDGMGGLLYGEVISRYVVERLNELYPLKFDDPDAVSSEIKKISTEVYEQYHLGAGATLVMAHIMKNMMNFYSVGDSNIILFRKGRATLLNHKQNYISLLIRKLAEGGMNTSEAYRNSRAKALIDFVGNTDTQVIHTSRPIQLYEDDIIVVSSDGLTDAVSLNKMTGILTPEYNAKQLARLMKSGVRNKRLPKQDNYSAVIIKMDRSII